MARKNLVGRLRHRVIIEKTTTSRGDTGEVIDIWVTYVTRWAMIKPLVGREFFLAQQEQSDITVKVVIRYDSLTKLINPRDYRLKIDSVIYDIDSPPINPQSMNRELQLMCRINNGG